MQGLNEKHLNETAPDLPSSRQAELLNGNIKNARCTDGYSWRFFYLWAFSFCNFACQWLATIVKEAIYSNGNLAKKDTQYTQFSHIYPGQVCAMCIVHCPNVPDNHTYVRIGFKVEIWRWVYTLILESLFLWRLNHKWEQNPCSYIKGWSATMLRTCETELDPWCETLPVEAN